MFLLARLAALDGQEAVAWVLVNDKASWQVAAFRALVLAEVVNALLLATAKRDVLAIQVVCYTF